MEMYPVDLDHDSQHRESTVGVAVQVEEKDRVRVYLGRDLKRGALHGMALQLALGPVSLQPKWTVITITHHDQRKRRKTRLRGSL